jgi:hypothetical protein
MSFALCSRIVDAAAYYVVGLCSCMFDAAAVSRLLYVIVSLTQQLMLLLYVSYV